MYQYTECRISYQLVTFIHFQSRTFAAAKSAWRWLFAPKTYFAADGEGVTANGLQIIGINILAAAVCLVLSFC